MPNCPTGWRCVWPRDDRRGCYTQGMVPRKPAPAQQDFFSHPVTRGPSAAQSAITAHIDGGARGNPGPAGFGVVVTDHQGKVLAELGRYLGHRTNNFAEYSALLAALEYATAHGHHALRVVSDSELLVRQMRGMYKVKSPDLKPLYEQARSLVRRLEWFQIEHVRREKNKDADRLANQAMDSGR
jgi:ribonuclease HI